MISAIVLACGIFGNISDADLERTVRHVSMLGHTATAVIWIRHRREPDLTPSPFAPGFRFFTFVR